MSSVKTTIFRITKDYPDKGVSSYGLQPVFYYLSKEQAKLGNDVHVITRRASGQHDIETNEGVTIHRVGDPFNFGALTALKSMLDRTKSQVIHTHATAGIFLAPLKKWLRTPLVCHVH